jgi:Na+/H+-dicarboxylate symporter
MAIWPVSVEVPTTLEDVQELPGLLDLVLRLIPANPFAAAADGALLPLIVFTLLVAAAAGTVEGARRHRIITLAEDFSRVFVRLIHWILWTAPAGVFGLAAPAVARMGLGLLAGLAVFVGTVVVGLFVFMGLVYLPAVWLLGKKGIGEFVRGVTGSYVTGFSTTSSVASLPVMFEDTEALGVSPVVSSLVLSLGAAINRAGSSLFQAGALVFLASLYGMPLPLTTLVSAGFVGFVVAMSVAPVPSASIVTLAPILEVAGVPLAGLGLLLGIDRIPDMFRSATNVTGHVAAAVTVEGLVGGEVATESEAALESV